MFPVDLVRLRKREAAQRVLLNALTNRRWRVYSTEHERVTLLYAELAVQARRSATPALFAFRTLCQPPREGEGQGHLPVLERVLRTYRTYAEDALALALASGTCSCSLSFFLSGPYLGLCRGRGRARGRGDGR